MFGNKTIYNFLQVYSYLYEDNVEIINLKKKHMDTHTYHKGRQNKERYIHPVGSMRFFIFVYACPD